MTTSQPTDPDPNGDVVSLVGQDEVPIKVSSTILKLASPVFKRMFGPQWREGEWTPFHPRLWIVRELLSLWTTSLGCHFCYVELFP